MKVETVFSRYLMWRDFCTLSSYNLGKTWIGVDQVECQKSIHRFIGPSQTSDRALSLSDVRAYVKTSCLVVDTRLYVLPVPYPLNYQRVSELRH